MNKFNYFDVPHAINEHDYIIEISGGCPGIKNAPQLDSVLTHIQNDDYYPCLVNKLTHLVFALTNFHMFEDGNKRSALALGGYFLTINGYQSYVQNFFNEMEDIVVLLAENYVDKEFLEEILYDLVHNIDFTQSTKLKLFNIYQQKDADLSQSRK